MGVGLMYRLDECFEALKLRNLCDLPIQFPSSPSYPSLLPYDWVHQRTLTLIIAAIVSMTSFA